MFISYCHAEASHSLYLKRLHNGILNGYSYNPLTNQGWHSAMVTAVGYLKPYDTVYVQLYGQAFGDTRFSTPVLYFLVF